MATNLTQVKHVAEKVVVCPADFEPVHGLKDLGCASNCLLVFVREGHAARFPLTGVAVLE